MKPEDRALLVVVVAVIVVAGLAAAYFVVAAGSSQVVSGILPVPAGTVFTSNESEVWAAHFTVSPGGGRLVGAWDAFNGYGAIEFFVVNGTVPRPSPSPGIYMCPILFHWNESNGTIDVPLGPGAHTAYWTTGYCSNSDRIVVTQTIQVVGP
jgi:hypothetical protein